LSSIKKANQNTQNERLNCKNLLPILHAIPSKVVAFHN